VTRPAAADRTARLVAAREDAARGTQKRTLKAIQEMRSRQDRISFAAVQRAAGVSTWFVYNNRQVRAAIEEAIALQDTEPSQASTPARRDDRTLPGLRSDLVDARDEIRALRTERDRLRQRLQRVLGNEITNLSLQEAAQRVGELEQQNQQLQTELIAVERERGTLSRKVSTLEDELTGARAALRRMMVKGNVTNSTR
jgi:HAMP domain-containing protein